ncbi:hypothetical protein GO684_00630 [Wolbachia endosymbiont of Litomosoides brasiliensis]|nr:hypothetical protein [Wolbachia endosymbiont of Litomosoides brasiliensis]
MKQKLFCSVWLSINRYEESRSSFTTFVSQVTKYRAINLINKRLCVKCGSGAGLLFIDSAVPVT